MTALANSGGGWTTQTHPFYSQVWDESVTPQRDRLISSRNYAALWPVCFHPSWHGVENREPTFLSNGLPNDDGG